MKLTAIDPQLEVESRACQRSVGLVLLNDYMRPRNLTIDDLVRLSGIPAWHVRHILGGARIYGEEALQLATALHTSALYWLMLQACYDLDRAGREAAQVAEVVH